jgi:predicted TIM-barrel fold metal-dependent hydrolase
MSARPAGEAPLCLPPLPFSRPPLRPLPPGTVDSHFHAFKDGLPWSMPRSYTPPVSTIAEWLAVADALGIAYGVLVQASVTGFDNSMLLDAITVAPDRLRGIAVVRPDVTTAELKRLHGLGIRGIRCNTRNLGGMSFEDAIGLARKIAPLGWSIQFQLLAEQLETLADVIPTMPDLPVVIDHFGFTDPRQPDVAQRLQRLLDTGDTYVKISGAYRLSPVRPFAPVAPIATALVASHPENLIWGSDWPHTELWENVPDDADILDATETWLGSGSVRERIFSETPRRLFFYD